MTNTARTHPHEEFLRLDKFPFIWCPGCGHGIIVKSFLRVIDKLAIPKDEISLISGIGCSSRAPGYLDFNTLHTTHGRALTFATGIKLAKPKLNVVVFSGDGDLAAIGGNHLIHACRRNINITVLVFNNNIYGMTGGQLSPTTPRGAKASTAPFGSIDSPFDIAELSAAAGASFVGRTTVYHTAQADKLIEKGLQKNGFSVIEIMSMCPTAFGRRNRLGGPVEMIKQMKKDTIALDKAQQLSNEELKGKITTGIFADRDRREYVSEYLDYCQRISSGNKE